MKLSVPISCTSLTKEDLPKILAAVKACKADRVFICRLGNIYLPGALTDDTLRFLKNAVDTFHTEGIEVGLWIGTLGHGLPLVGDFEEFPKERYTSLTGIHGDKPEQGLCPLDETLREDFAAAITKLARLGPDIIMTDDDLRISRGTHYYFGCFCEKHLELFYKETGERIPREELEKKIFAGGPNKYRDAYLKVTAQGLSGFVARMRQAIDTVDSSIRFAVCTPPENWDATGLHMPDFARLFAGNTRPLLRTYGAPYWPSGIAHVVECTRMQCAALKGSGIEIMAEGDVYPRPRYNISSRSLELYTYALIADGNCEGLLGYLFDYYQKADYETGYIDRYTKTAPLREALAQLFAGKLAAGIYLHHEQHKVRNWVLPEEPLPEIATRISFVHRPASFDTISPISIPSAYEQGDYPCMIVGENARTATTETIKNGAILDATAAMLLSQKGIDTGIVTCEEGHFLQEHYLAPDDTIPNIDCGGLRKITCSKKATVLSRFDDGSPASYTYENAAGNRFYVIAFDHFFTDHKAYARNNFLNNYYRQADMMATIPWMCGRKLPVTCRKNPNLYVYTAKKGNAMSVLLLNLHMDSIDLPILELDQTYTSIKTVNCAAAVEGDKVTLSELHPYSMAAFEVSC